MVYCQGIQFIDLVLILHQVKGINLGSGIYALTIILIVGVED
jgi:hypothetical protein